MVTKPPPHLTPNKTLAGVQPLFERKFHTGNYIYADDAKKPTNPPPVRSESKNLAALTGAPAALVSDKYDASREHEEKMIRAIDSVEMVPGPDGNLCKYFSEDSWSRMKRFVLGTIADKRQREKEVADLKKKLSQYKELEDLEHRVAQLQAQRIELMRELATKEMRFADESSLRTKLEDVLSRCDSWCESTREVCSGMHMEKKASDKLRRGLQWLRNFPDLHDRHKGHEATPFASHARLSGSECHVVHRTSRLVSGRYCIITMYWHVRGGWQPPDWPYRDPTYASADEWTRGTIGKQGENDDQISNDQEGMAALMRSLMDEHTCKQGENDGDVAVGGDEASLVPTLLIVVYDVLANDYSMVEILPDFEELTQNRPRDGGLGAIALEALFIKHLEDQVQIKLDRKSGRLVVSVPGQRPPMRQVFKGHVEVRGGCRTGLLHVAVFEHDIKTWIVRLYDTACCRLYSHLVPKALLATEDDDDDAEDEVRELSHIDQLLSRLTFDGHQLSLPPRASQPKPSKPPAVGPPPSGSNPMEQKDAQALVSLKSSKFWAQQIVVNHGARLGPSKAYMLVRAAVSPPQDMMGIVLYDPIGKTTLEQLFCFSELCQQQLGLESSRENSSLKAALEKISQASKNLDGAKHRNSEGSRHVDLDRKASQGNIGHEQPTLYGVTEGNLKRVLAEMLDRLRLDKEFQMYFGDECGEDSGPEDELKEADESKARETRMSERLRILELEFGLRRQDKNKDPASPKSSNPPTDKEET